jgi:hypothetical protein
MIDTSSYIVEEPGGTSNLDNDTVKLLTIAVLVQRLGGEVYINQEDLDSIAYHFLEEHSTDEGMQLVVSKRVISS